VLHRYCGFACSTPLKCQDGDLGASLRLMKRDLAANPASCAGDHSDGAIQFSHKNFLLI
jgi:hypothetical protein